MQNIFILPFDFVWCLCVYNIPERKQCCSFFFPCSCPIMNASLQLRRYFQMFSGTETSEPLRNPPSSCPSVVVKYLSCLSFACSPHPALPQSSLAGSAGISELWPLCSEQGATTDQLRWPLPSWKSSVGSCYQAYVLDAFSGCP